MGTGREGVRRDGGLIPTRFRHSLKLRPAGSRGAFSFKTCVVQTRACHLSGSRTPDRVWEITTLFRFAAGSQMAKQSAKKTKSPGAPPPPPKSFFASENVVGWVQFGALLIGVAALVWSVFAYYVPPPQPVAVASFDGRAQTIEETLVEEDFKSLRALHRAIDYVSIYDVNHTNFEEGSRTLVSFMAARAVVLKRHDLSEAFAEFSAAFEACRNAPTHENIVRLRSAARAFAEPLDEALQRFGRIAAGKPGTRTAQRR